MEKDSKPECCNCKCCKSGKYDYKRGKHKENSKLSDIIKIGIAVASVALVVDNLRKK